MPTYTKTTWVNGAAPAVSATNLNKIETGIDNATSLTGQGIVTASGWTATTEGGFAVKKDVAIPGATASMCADILFTTSTIAAAQDANVGYVTTYGGGITFYADNAPSTTLEFDFILTKADPWTPAILGSRMALWLDGADTSRVMLTSGVVSAWYDKSGRGRDVYQGTAANCPTYPVGLNSKNVVRFDGSNDFLDGYPSLTTGNYAGEFNVFLFGKLNSSVGGTWVAERLTTLVGISQCADVGTIFLSSDGANSASNHTINATTRDLMLDYSTWGHLHTAGVRDILFANGAQQSVIAGTASNITGNETAFRIGGRFDTSSFLNGDIGEILIIAGAVSTDLRQRIEGYFAWKWGGL